MVIAVIDTQNQPDGCAAIVRRLLPRAACLITPTVGEIWGNDVPVPPLSGILVHGSLDSLGQQDRDGVSEMARRFPFCSTSSAEEDLSRWATLCVDFRPQMLRQPDRLPWETAVAVTLPGRKRPRRCKTANVSLGGIYIADTRSKPRLGDRLTLRFSEFASPLHATAVVRWVQPKDADTRPAGYGCQFVDTSLWVPGLLVQVARTGAVPTAGETQAVAPSP